MNTTDIKVPPKKFAMSSDSYSKHPYGFPNTDLLESGRNSATCFTLSPVQLPKSFIILLPLETTEELPLAKPRIGWEGPSPLGRRYSHVAVLGVSDHQLIALGSAQGSARRAASSAFRRAGGQGIPPTAVR